MTEIKKRIDNPEVGINYQEIFISDSNNWSTGSYEISFNENFLNVGQVVNNYFENTPFFKIIINFNCKIGGKEIEILLGNSNSMDPILHKYFYFPKDFKFSQEAVFMIEFKNWQIAEIKLNNQKLNEIDSRYPINKPIPEHEGIFTFNTPSPNVSLDLQKEKLKDIFDFEKELIFTENNQGNTKIKICRNKQGELVYNHFNPTFGERILKIDISDLSEGSINGFFLLTGWSFAKNYFNIIIFYNDGRENEHREKTFINEDKLVVLKKEVHEFEDLLNKSEKEEEVHQYLKNNSSLLGITSLIKPISKFKLGSEYIPDFVIRETIEGCIFIEIEKANLRLFKRNPEIEKTQELNHAIQQIDNWRSWISQNYDYLKKHLPDVGIKPTFWIIAGRTINLEQDEKNKLEELNQLYKEQYKILTYDDILEKIKTIINNLD